MAKKQMIDYEEKAGKIWELYEKGIQYQQVIGITKSIPENIRFYEGDQWPKPTKDTQNFPRPVINIIKFICRNKKANVFSSKVRNVYRSEDGSANGTRFTKFGEYIEREMGLEQIESEVVDSAMKKGTGIIHYYWDKYSYGKDGIQSGALRAESINPLNFIVSNPQERDIQKQDWVIISTREKVNVVKEMADKDIDKELILKDDSQTVIEKEQEGNNLVTVITRYFRVNGEVYFEKSTRNTLINKPRPLAPNIKYAKKVLGLEDEDNIHSGLPEYEETSFKRPKAPYYPLEVFPWDDRENSIYGIGEVEGLIPNQKAVNFNIAIQLLNLQSVWGGKYIVAPNALQDQEITNEPGQVLTDYTKTMNGIKRLTDQTTFNDMPIRLVDKITELTRVVSGSTEVMTGESTGANSSGAYIAQLQSQGLKVIEEYKQKYWRFKERCGKILAMFFKLFYEDKEFTYTEKDEEYNDVINIDIFNGSEYENTDLDVSVEAVEGTKGNELIFMNFLQDAVNKGLLTYEEMLYQAPDSLIPNKAELIKGIRKRQQNEVNILTRQLEEATMKLKQASEVIEAQNESVNNAAKLIQENKRLKELLLKLQAEYTQKIGIANQKLTELNTDATQFAQQIFNEKYARNKGQTQRSDANLQKSQVNIDNN